MLYGESNLDTYILQTQSNNSVNFNANKSAGRVAGNSYYSNTSVFQENILYLSI